MTKYGRSPGTLGDMHEDPQGCGAVEGEAMNPCWWGRKAEVQQ
jgi:hypothetical protein